MKIETTEQIAKKLGKQPRGIDAPSPVFRVLRALLTKTFKKKSSGPR